MPLGGGDKCPKCGRTVYFAEEKRALGRKYHSACLKCAECNKPLDSTNCNEHDTDLFCNGCYRKNFGPQGYGFAGGAAGLCASDGARTTSISSPTEAPASSSLGGGDSCPRCHRAVYLAEKVIGAGRSYHKSCFKCNSCSKGLDSTTLCQRDDDIYCKACYSRLFGPKGYGYAGGASGLSMDTGRPNEICRENVSHLAQAQVPQRGGAGDSAGGEVCSTCGKAVYFAERVAGMGKVYHKSCFKCQSCRRNLDSTLLTEHNNEIYCKACYGKKFGPKGFGFGTAMMPSA